MESKLIFGDNEIITESVYPYRYDSGKGKEVLRVTVDANLHSFNELLQMKGIDSFDYYELEEEEYVLKNTYTNYIGDFSCSYNNDLYSVELTRISETDIKVTALETENAELKERLALLEDCIVELSTLASTTSD